MNEIDIVLLDQRELPTILKDIVVLESSLDTKEKLALSGAELRTETETEHTVLGSDKTVLVKQTTVPVVAFPELTLTGFPMVADLAEKLESIAIFERMLIADCSVQCRREQESGIDCKFTLSGSTKGNDGTYECDKKLLHGLLVEMEFILIEQLLEYVSVKAVCIEDILILNGESDDSTAYLVL